jgi:pyrroline-5-carboxylate reductase
MGEALLSGLLGGARPAYRPEHLVVVEQYPDRAAYLRDTYGVSTVPVDEAARQAGTVLLLVKPHHVDGALAQLDPHVTTEHLIVSAAGGITTAQIERGLTARPPVVRCMPNTAVSVGHGMTAISAGTHADASHLDRTAALMEPVGRVIRVPEEQLDAVTALSGSGPAYFFFLAEALIDAGVLLGLTRPMAVELVTQTAVGAALMLRDSGTEPAALRAAVSSPAGTTIAAIRALEDRAARAATMAAALAARDRSVELGRKGAAR